MEKEVETEAGGSWETLRQKVVHRSHCVEEEERREEMLTKEE